MVNAFLGKKYSFDTSDSVNFDEYMKSCGVNLINRKLGNTVGHTVVLTLEGDVYTFKTTSLVKNFQIVFKLGEEFDQETADGRKVKAVVTLEGNKLTEVQTLPDGRKTTLTREFSATDMKMVMTVGDIVSTRGYKAVA